MVAESQPAQSNGHVADGRIASRFALFAAFILSAWLLGPALTPAHVEGFSAAVAALGLHLTQGTLASFDQLEPLNTEYFGLTKLGMVMSIGAITSGLHISADLAFRLLMWAGLAALLGSSGWLIKRWTSAGWPIALAPLVILPGVFESSFIFCDNVLAAGLAGCALCLLYSRTPLLMPLAGIAFAFAVLTRTDTVLVSVVIPIILVERFGLSRRALGWFAAMAVPGGIAAVGTLAFFGASPFDVIRVGAAAVAAWDRPLSGKGSIAIVDYFLGVGGIALVGMGIYQVIREKRVLPALRLLAPVAVLIFVVRDSLWQTRQLLALTPFFGALAAIALRTICYQVVTNEQRLARAGVFFLIGISLIGPVTGIGFADGPRVFTGRVWNIATVRNWQARSRSDVAALDGLIQQTKRLPLTVLVADGWDEDRYLHLSLLDRGYVLRQADTLPIACRAAADHYQHGATNLVVIRNYQSFVPYAQGLTAIRFEQRSLPCARALASSPLVFVSTAPQLAELFPAGYARSKPDALDDHRPAQQIAKLSYRQLASGLDTATQARLIAAYARQGADDQTRAIVAHTQLQFRKTIADGVQATRAQTGFPGKS